MQTIDEKTLQLINLKFPILLAKISNPNYSQNIQSRIIFKLCSNNHTRIQTGPA